MVRTLSGNIRRVRTTVWAENLIINEHKEHDGKTLILNRVRYSSYARPDDSFQ
jgi:hypothetical protein